MKEANPAIIIFVRHPELGKVKTRLAASMGDENALAVYKFLLAHTYALVQHRNIPVFVFYAEDIVEGDLWSCRQMIKRVQKGNDLGERMTDALREVFAAGCEKAVIIGSDCYELTDAIIDDAFALLEKNDIVVGPAKDGGYYLLGMNAPFKDLFSNMEWSVATVFDRTMQRAREARYRVDVLPVLSDVDTEEDINFSYR